MGMTDAERRKKIECNIEAISSDPRCENDEMFDYLFATVIMLNERLNELSAPRPGDIQALL